MTFNTQRLGFIGLLFILGCNSPTSITVKPVPKKIHVAPANYPTDLDLVPFKNLTILFQPGPAPYDPDAKAAGIQGTVIVDFAIREDGSVYSAKAISGPVELYSYCENYAKGFRYKPYSPDGVPKKIRSLLTCVLKLQ